MKIQVGGYTYWCDFPVEVGDTVEVTRSKCIGGGTQHGVVDQIGSDYDGEITESVVKVLSAVEAWKLSRRT